MMMANKTEQNNRG